jgi:RNA-directed DNA polymerase
LSSPTVSTKLARIAEQSAHNPEMVFTTLAHHMDVEFLREAFRRVRPKAAPGVDGVTWAEYAKDLEANLTDLHGRLKAGRYQAPPVRRKWIAKEDGRRRPLGIPTLEDKIVQRAVGMLLEAVYEPMFQSFSYGFRPGRSAHQAVAYLRTQCLAMNINWIVDADVSGYFDNIDHGHLRAILKRRVNDGALMRLIGEWLNAGVLEEGRLMRPETGTPQGGVISPILANIYLNAILDEWFVQEVQPRLGGRCFLVRFADDCAPGNLCA